MVNIYFLVPGWNFPCSHVCLFLAVLALCTAASSYVFSITSHWAAADRSKVPVPFFSPGWTSPSPEASPQMASTPVLIILGPLCLTCSRLSIPFLYWVPWSGHSPPEVCHKCWVGRKTNSLDLLAPLLLLQPHAWLAFIAATSASRKPAQWRMINVYLSSLSYPKAS